MATELQSAIAVSTPSGGLDSHMFVIFCIMFLAGVLGGIANYFLSERPTESAKKGEWIRFLILGIVAALTVPSFLNMMSSTLLEGARTKPIDFFTFAGFCLIYVIGLGRIFEDVASKFMPQIEQVKRDMQHLKQRREAPPPPPPVVKEEKVETPPEPKLEPREALSYNDIEILRALAEESYVYGNLAALCEKTRLGRELVSQRLMLMKSMGVIETRINEKNVLHWFVSPRGKQVLAEILAGEDKKTA